MGQSGNILLVEDEEIVALMAETALKKEGYRVFAFTNARDALAISESEEFVLLIADVNLPGSIDGVALAKMLRRKSPHLPVVLTSGSFDESRSFDEALQAFLLPKPFRKSRLLEVMRCSLSVPV